MKCDACGSTEEIIDCRAAASQVNICENWFCRSHIAIAAKINTRKNEEILWLKAMVQELKCCANCKWDVEGDEEVCDGCCMPELKKWEAR
jgi:hypothetical protein